MKRRIAVVDDMLTSGGWILDYEQLTGFFFHGRKAALLGNKAYCEKCKSTGTLAKAGGPYRLHYHSTREIALDNDIVLCNCDTPPRIIARLSGESWCWDRSHNQMRGTVADGTSATRTNNVDAHWISFALQERGSGGGLRCVAYFEDDTEEYGAFSADKTVRFERFSNRSACSHIELLLDDDTKAFGSVAQALLSVITR
jgi:hypothetical protein